MDKEKHVLPELKGSVNNFLSFVSTNSLFDLLMIAKEFKKPVVDTIYNTGRHINLKSTDPKHISAFLDLYSIKSLFVETIPYILCDDKVIDHLSQVDNLALHFYIDGMFDYSRPELTTLTQALARLKGFDNISFVKLTFSQGNRMVLIKEEVKKMTEIIASYKNLKCLSSNLRSLSLTEQIINLKHLTFLSLTHCNLVDEDLRPLTQDSIVSELDLSSNWIKDRGCKFISSLTYLKTLNLADNKVNDKGCMFLKELSLLNILNLESNCVSDQGCFSLSKCISLTSLNLRGNSITDDGLIFIAKMDGLVDLKFSKDQITQEGLENLHDLPELVSFSSKNEEIFEADFDFIENKDSIRSVSFESCDIVDEDCIYLQKLGNIEDLSLRTNCISEEGCIYIATLDNLTVLDLSDNSIGDNGLVELHTLVNLTSLDVKANKLTDKGVIEFLKNLQDIRLKNLVDTEFNAFLDKIDESNAKLLVNEGVSSFLTSLDEKLERSETEKLRKLLDIRLKRLNLAYNKVSNTVFDLINQLIEHLEYLDLTQTFCTRSYCCNSKKGQFLLDFDSNTQRYSKQEEFQSIFKSHINFKIAFDRESIFAHEFDENEEIFEDD